MKSLTFKRDQLCIKVKMNKEKKLREIRSYRNKMSKCNNKIVGRLD